MNSIRHLFAAIAVIFLASGCVTNGTRPVADYQMEGSTPVAQYNGFRFSPVAYDALSQDATRPHIRSVSDIKGADKLIKLYADLSWKAFAAGDYESFLVARSLATNMARARLAQNLTSMGITHSYMGNNGNALLPPSSVGFMPHKLYAEKARVAMDELGHIQLTRLIDTESGEKVEVAAGPGFFGIPSMPTYGNNRELQRQREANAWGKNPNSLLSMPVGSAYVATNKDGQRFIVENTPEGFLFYNTGEAPVRVNLEELDYFPILDAPSPVRKKSAPIVNNIGESIDSIYLPLMAKGDIGSNAYTVQPAQMIITTYPTIQKDLDKFGRIATAKKEIEEGKRAYLTNPEYKMAINLMGTRRFESKEANEFFMKCGGGRVKRIRYEGEALEYIRMSCLENGGLVYTQRLIVTDDFKFKTYASLREDKRLAERIRAVLDDASLLEAIASFAPGLGIADAGLRCLGQESATVVASKLYSHFFDSQNYRMGVEKFVEEQLSSNNDPSYVSKALDCSLMAGAASKATQAAIKAKPGYEAFAKSDRFNKVLDTINQLNQNFVGPGAGKAWKDSFATIDKTFGSGATAGKLLKTVYETAQGSMSISGLAEQMAANDGLKSIMLAWYR